MTTDPHDSTHDHTTNDQSEIDEQDIPVELQLNDAICLTPESAVGGLLVNSPAGSGPVIYPDFHTAIRDAWGQFESEYTVHGKPRMGEAIPPELREGRRAFKVLLDRFEHEGYSSDMAQELNDLCYKYTPYRIVEVDFVLPDGLEMLLETAYGRLDDEEDEAARVSAPPRDEFDLDDPAHLEWLAQQLDFWRYI